MVYPYPNPCHNPIPLDYQKNSHYEDFKQYYSHSFSYGHVVHIINDNMNTELLQHTTSVRVHVHTHTHTHTHEMDKWIKGLCARKYVP